MALDSLDNIESIYPLSPMQTSMLFYAQSRITAKAAGIASAKLTNDVLFNQTNIDISGHIDVDAFKKAWQQIAADNSAFRTGFLWEGLKQAQQFVRKEIDLPFEFTSLVEYDDAGKKESLQNMIDKITKDDIAKGFTLTSAPLMRIHLIQIKHDQYRLIWSCHHLVIDRWCIPIVFQSLTKHYDELLQNQIATPIKSPPYKRYIAYLHKLKSDNSERYWRENLAHFSTPSQLCTPDANAPQLKLEHLLDQTLMAQVSQFCRSNKITLASFFQSAWSLMLNQALGLQDVIYGLVVSGRPAAIKDVENIVGTFVNNVPVRQRMDGQASTLQWLKQNQSSGFLRIEHEHESVATLHDYTQLQADEPLFDHVLVWQNAAPLSKSEHFEMQPVLGNLQTAYPLTLSIEEKDQSLQIVAMINAGWQLSVKDTLFTTLESVMSQLVKHDSEQSLTDMEGFVLSDRFVPEGKIETTEVASPLIDKQSSGEKVKAGRTALDKGMVEEYLLREWKSILELDTIDVDDDFFALGGNSLKAAQLVARLELAEKKHIPIIQLFEGRTIRTMAQVYLSADWSVKPGWVIPVNTKGQGKPVFYIASPEVNVIGYAQLARELGSDINGYIVQPPPQSEHVRQVRTADMPALSLEYIKEIQKIQKEGPYHVIGMCSGAHISGEIMRQMQKQSLEVGYYAIINTWSLYSISFLYHLEELIIHYRTARYYVKRVLNIKWSEIRQRFLPIILNKIKSKLKMLPTQTDDINHQSDPQSEYAAPARQFDETVSPIKEEKWASELPPDIAIIKYPMTVFRIESKPYWRINSYELGWDRLAQQVKVIHLREPTHEAILRDPHIAHFASQLREELLNTTSLR